MATKAEAQTSALGTADSLYAVGNYSEAVEVLKDVASSKAVLIRLAQAQKANGNLKEAIKAYKVILEDDPERVITTVAYGKLLSATGKLKEADSIFLHLIKKFPTSADFFYQLGLVREKQNDSTAMELYYAAVFREKTHQKALVKVSKNALGEGKLKSAERYCKQGLKVNPSNKSLRSILAQTYYYQKDYESAAEEFERLIETGAGSEFIHGKLGTLYFHLGKYEKAIEHFNSSLDYDEQNYMIHYNLGKLYALTGKFEKSEGHLLQSIILKAVTLDAEFTSLGLTYKLMGKPQKALSYFNKAIDENPGNERAMYERAIAADSYFKDLQTRMNYYQQYLDRFEEKGSPNLLLLAMRRVQDIREEIHLSGSGAGRE